MGDWFNGYVMALRIDVEKDLEENLELAESLGKFKSRFVTWCAHQRTVYEADIVDEIDEFKTKFISSRLYDVDIKLWRKLRKEVFARDNFTCKYCAKIGGILEVDHVVPLSRGGTNDIENLATSCRNCNRRKRDMTAEEFIKRGGLA